jgi:hypothetical protein
MVVRGAFNSLWRDLTLEVGEINDDELGVGG